MTLAGTLEVAFLMAVAGCEPVDEGAANRAKSWNGDLTDNVLDSDRDVFIDTDESMTVADGCAKTELDAHQILQDNCAGCHDKGSDSKGAPIFDFVMNDTKLKSSMWTPPGGTPLKFISVGKPDESAIFLRVGVNRDMPMLGSSPELPRVTFSGVSVLRQWIEVCMN